MASGSLIMTSDKARSLSASRNIYISDSDGTNTGTAVSFNGSANATFKLPATIKATLTGSATSAGKATNDSDGNAINTTYLKKSGGTLTGGVTFVGNLSSAWNNLGILFTNGSRLGEHINGVLGIYGAGDILMRPSSGSAIHAAGTYLSTTSFYPSLNGQMNLGVASTNLWNNVYANEFIGNLKSDQIIPAMTKTYENVIATANDLNGAGFFYAKVRGTTYHANWHVKVRVSATVPGLVNYNTISIFDIWATANTYSAFKCQNLIKNTSNRPIYYNCLFRLTETGYNNNMGDWLGFSLLSSNNNTNTSYKRTIKIEILEYENCTIEMLDTLITPTNIPSRTTSGYYTSTNTEYDNFDAYSNGLQETGDATANDTDRTLQELFYFRYKTGAAGVGRYTLLMEESTGVYSSLTTTFPSSNTPLSSLTMNTGVKYKLDRILYFNAGANRAANTNIGNNSQYFIQYDLIDLRYTFQFTAGTLTAYLPFYMVGTLDDQGYFTIDPAATAWTLTLPSTANGKVYVFLGMVYPDTSTYRIELESLHPVYGFINGKIREILPGHSTTSEKWVSTKSFTIGNKSQSVDGSTNVTWNLNDVLIRAGNEFNFTANGMSDIWFNYKSQSGTVTSTKINCYHFGNGQEGKDTTLYAGYYSGDGFVFNGTSSSGANWINGPAGSLYFGGNFHIDSVSPHHTYINFYSNKNVLLCAGSSKGNVGIGIEHPLSRLHVVGDTRINREFHSTSESSQCGTLPLGILGFKNGYPVYDDPEFANGTNSVEVYNNIANDSITITRISMTSGNNSGYALLITKSSAAANPKLGGFCLGIWSKANATFVLIFRAKIPIGYQVNDAQNSLGANAAVFWITDRAGTGKWEWYGRVTLCGDSGSFSKGGHVCLSKTDSSVSDAVTWYLSYCNCFDITHGEYDGLRTKFADVTTYFKYDRNSGTAFDCNNPNVTIYSDYGMSGRSCANAPTGWVYGGIFTIGTANDYGSMSSQFCWDVAHGSNSAGTLWWRSNGAKASGSGFKDWCKIITSDLLTVKNENISNNAIEIGAYLGALNSGGWKALGGRSVGAKLYIAYNNAAANWNSEWYSSSIVFGCGDTKGLVDCGHYNPIVTFGGGSVSTSDDNSPRWYMRILGAANKVYELEKFVVTDSTQTITGSKTFNSAILMPASVSAAATSQPTALSYGRLQGCGTFCINADTDGSQDEYCIITAGRGCSSTTTDGFWVGYSKVGTSFKFEHGGVLGGSWIQGTHDANFVCTVNSGLSTGNYYQGWYAGKTPSGSWSWGNLSGYEDCYFCYGTDANYNSGNNFTSSIKFGSQGKVYNAVWNDYAEYRISNDQEPGRVIAPNSYGIAERTTQRLLANSRIISDTYGMAIGQTDKALTPVGLIGRVLVYPYRNINEYKIGDCVCSAPNGTVDIMTREEIKEWPDRIIGFVNEIPNYDIWDGTLTLPNKGKNITTIEVHGRIWIDIK